MTDVIDKATNAAVAAVQKVANRETNDMSAKAVSEASPALETAIKTAVANVPEIKTITNTEDHWYQKRSRWSAIISIGMTVAGPLLTKFGLPIDPSTQEWIATTLTTVGGLWASYLAYRAGTASKPLGA